ncbi:nucleoside diphosphate kinase regulator [Hoeflea sp. YIM 152468]|uniref:nucleoside diphosphate kinase regulator n=1 Tax=Hoeflea sp. YIM 152468 TaxID=3031759 RepID=UPI0023DAA5E2|nr:nucleoside diphosphate kinase regulator [Hoeflea sp. YIM 152468]MDF1609739.1 nucleoside diphosphate kinase regulator [Hoeflea sp. YIM 152468]
MLQKNRRKPRITISETDYARLNNLAAAYEQRSPEIAAALAEEIDRARVVSDKAIDAGVVRMGSTVTYEVDSNQSKTVTLVYPADANIDDGRISITTPVGSALIGLKSGQSISFATRSGQVHDLTVTEVTQTQQPVVAE